MAWTNQNENHSNSKNYLTKPMMTSTSNYNTLMNIRDLNPNLQNVKVRGLVISKKSLKLTKLNYENQSSNTSSGYKGVFNFTVRDSVNDCINVTSWGKSDYSRKLFSLFHIGDVILIINPIIERKNGKYEQYEVQTSSNYCLTINDKLSQIELYYGGDRNNMAALQNTLLHSMSDHVTLLNMIRYMESSPKEVQVKGQHFTFLAMVQEIGTPQDLLSKTQKDENNQNKILHKMDVVFMDESCKKFPLTIWELEWINFAQIHWIPGVTVVSLVDCKAKYDEYKRGIIGILDSRTVSIINPDIMESHKLRHLVNIHKALNCEMSTTSHDESRTCANDLMAIKPAKLESNIPLSSIQNVLSVKAILARSVDMEYGIVYGILSHFNIDDEDLFQHFIWLKCRNCKRRITMNQPFCTTLDCPMIGQNVTWTNQNAVEVEFNTVINIIDHTGTLTKCLLSGKIMEEFLRCDPYQLIEIDQKSRSQMKWNLFLNRYKFYVQNSLPSFNNSNPYTKILGIQSATVYEILASVKE